MKPDKPKNIRELLRSIENRSTPTQLDLLCYLWDKCPPPSKPKGDGWPPLHKPETEAVKNIMNKISPDAIAQALVQGIVVPLPVDPRWDDEEKADMQKMQDSLDSVVDIQLNYIEACRVDWVTNQLKQLEQILTNDED